MKAYKIRSLIYLSCFIIAAVFYYDMEQKELFQNSILASQTSEIQPEDDLTEDVIDEENTMEEQSN